MGMNCPKIFILSLYRNARDSRVKTSLVPNLRHVYTGQKPNKESFGSSNCWIAFKGLFDKEGWRVSQFRTINILYYNLPLGKLRINIVVVKYILANCDIDGNCNVVICNLWMEIRMPLCFRIGYMCIEFQ